MHENTPIVLGRDISKTFRRATGELVQALDRVSLEVKQGTLSALVGPDGAGKTTLIRLTTGLMTADAGELKILGIDVASHPQRVQERIGYMPQRFGLYEDLTVQENLDLYADMHNVSSQQRQERYPRLMEMTALGPFTRRLAGKLSGGMQRKLGLACSLVRLPELLVLDEPTVGVDPLSRRELWEIIQRLVKEQHLTVLLSTTYLDEADRCEYVVVLHQGKVLAQGRPSEVSQLAKGHTFLAKPAPGQPARELQARLLNDPGIIDAVPEGGQVRLIRSIQKDDTPEFEGMHEGLDIQPTKARFEDGFMVLIGQAASGDRQTKELSTQTPSTQDRVSDSKPQLNPRPSPSPNVVVEVRDLVRRFGKFTAVDHIGFEVRKGEIFGLLGPNGAGKTTTFRMICGLLSATSGILRVAGVDLRFARAEARRRIGYVAQKFSLYGQLSVAENLRFFASAYGLSGQRRRNRIDWALREFGLLSLSHLPAAQLPGGFKQRLTMAAALLHEPEILFLDEPTSGADPLARREFWLRITTLAKEGVTVVVTTHFMEEAEYCDRVIILDSGRVLAQGTPAEIRQQARPKLNSAPTMEDAFIAIVEQSRSKRGSGDEPLGEARHPQPANQNGTDSQSSVQSNASPTRHHGILAAWKRIASLVRKEARQIVRDPSSIAIGVVMPLILILLFGYGLSLDVKDVPVAVVLEDPSPDAMELAAGFQLSPYFSVVLTPSMPRARDLLIERKVDGIIRIRPDFSRHLREGDAVVEILAHGTDANHARIIQGYAQGAIAQWGARHNAENRDASSGPVVMQDRLWFNDANDSHYFLVPGLIVLVMTLIGSMLTAMGIAREWERGTLESIFVTPVRSFEILLGKTIPNFIMGMLGLSLCLLAAKFVFYVPFRGSFWVLAGASMLYLLVALAIGLLISSTVKNQFVASQLTMLVTFLPAMMLSGFLFDLHSMPTAVRLLTYLLPARYYVALLQTIFLAGNVWAVIVPNSAVLAGMATGLLLLTRRTAQKKLA